MPLSYCRPQSKARPYAPDVLPRLQNLLSTLADIDFAYECDLEVVQASAANEDLKTVAIGSLRQLRDSRRAPVLRQITALQERLNA
jgi:hypothetical protein